MPRCFDTCCRGEPDYNLMLATERRSRKPRTCGTCLGTIRPGEQYARHFWPGIDGERSMTTIEHSSPGICYAEMT